MKNHRMKKRKKRNQQQLKIGKTQRLQIRQKGRSKRSEFYEEQKQTF